MMFNHKSSAHLTTALPLRMIAAVAFVPPHDVIDALAEVADLIRLQYQVVGGLVDDVLTTRHSSV